MTLDDLLDRADELGIRTDMPLVVHEPGEGFYTIEELTITSYGELRLVIQAGVEED